MKKTMRLSHLLGILVILAVAAVAQTAFAATTIEKIQVSGDSVSATWSSSDSCNWNYTAVTASTSGTKNNGPPAQAAYLYINTYNSCTGASSLGFSEPNPEWFQLLVQSTRSATLKGNIPMHWTTWDPIAGYNEFGGNAAVDLQWKGNANPQRSVDRTRNQTLNFMSSYRYSGLTVTATLSGSITLDGNPYPMSGDYLDATIVSGVTGQMTILRSDAPPPQATRLPPTGNSAANAGMPLSSPATVVKTAR